MTKKKVYLAGPMRGIEQYNFPAFDKWRDILRERGYDVVSPADLDRDGGWDALADAVTDAPSLSEVVKRDLDALQQCDAIALMPGWMESTGATAEHAVAQFLQLEVIELEPEDVLVEALRITGGERQAAYGPPNIDFTRTAAMWSALWAANLREPMQARDVAHAMILLKVSRNQHRPKRDNWVDIAGYARCGAQIDAAGAPKEEQDG